MIALETSEVLTSIFHVHILIEILNISPGIFFLLVKNIHVVCTNNNIMYVQIIILPLDHK